MSLMHYDHRIDIWEQGAPNTIIWTSYTNETWLTALNETPPEVKTAYVEVPASDGVIDLTDAVAGRPLYGKREIDFTVENVSASHTAALEWLQDCRAAIHGKRLCISTPDSRALNGYYVGRVDVSQTITLEHAAVNVHVDCAPWIYYGVESVTLSAGTTQIVSAGTEIPTALRASYPQSMVTITKQYLGAIGEGTTPRALALVQAGTDNIADIPRQAQFEKYELANGDDWASGWTYSQVTQTAHALTYRSLKTQSTRMLLLTSKAGDDTSAGDWLATLSYYEHQAYIGVRIRGHVSDTDTTAGTPAINAIFHYGTVGSSSYGRGRTVTVSNGGLVASSSGNPTTIYEPVEIDENGDFDTFVTKNTGTLTGAQRNWATWGVETKYLTADITLEVYIGFVDAQSYIAPSNNVVLMQLPSGFYSFNGKSDYVTLSRTTPTMLTTYFREQGQPVPEELTTPDVYQIGAYKPTGAPKWLWANGYDCYGLYCPVSAAFAQQQSVTVDAGEMPTTMDIETSAPLQITIDGKTYTITTSGYAPFAFSGEKTLSYMLYGNQDAAITYEKGII